MASLHLTAVERLGPAGLLTVTHDALNQERLAQVYAAVVPGAQTHGLGKEATCATVVREALHRPEALERLAQELGRATHKERGLLDMLEETTLRERVLTLPQLTLRRERARLMWALAADARACCGDVLAEMLSELNAAVKAAQTRKVDVDVVPALTAPMVPPPVPPPPKDLVRERVERLEKERAEFLAQLGMREAAWRGEVEARAEAERQAALWRARAREADENLQDTRAQLQNALVAARAPATSGTRADRLAERLLEMEADRDTWKDRAESLEDQLSNVLRNQAQLAQQLVSRDVAAQQRIARLRESLRDVRRQRARGAGHAPDGGGEQRTAVHVDVANLAASARHRHGGRVDFVALLRWLGEGRRVVRAVAYCVEHGDAERFAGFANALRSAGYDVRTKRPRARADGTIKADWDMALAMDVVEDPARVDTVVVCSGDGDFLPLLETMRRRGKRVEVCAFPEDTHDDLRRAAHLFHALDASHTRKNS